MILVLQQFLCFGLFVLPFLRFPINCPILKRLVLISCVTSGSDLTHKCTQFIGTTCNTVNVLSWMFFLNLLSWQISSLRQRKLNVPKGRARAASKWGHTNTNNMVREWIFTLQDYGDINTLIFLRLWIKDCEYMFGKIFENFSTFFASYNSKNSLTFQQSTLVIFCAVELSQKLAIESLEGISNSDMLVNRLNSHEMRSAWSRDWLRGTDLQTTFWAQTGWLKVWLQRSARQERGWADELLGVGDCSSASVRLFLYCFLPVTESGAAWRNRKFSTNAFSVRLLYFLLYLWFWIFCVDFLCFLPAGEVNHGSVGARVPREPRPLREVVHLF